MADILKLPTVLTEQAHLEVAVEAEMDEMLDEAVSLGGDDDVANLLSVLGSRVATLSVSIRELVAVVDMLVGEDPSG